MAKFAVIARQSLIDLLRAVKKGSLRTVDEGRYAGEGALEQYSKWKKNVPGRTEAMKAYRSKTGSSLSPDKVLIPRGLLNDLRGARSWKQGDEMPFKTEREKVRLSKTRMNSTRDQEV
jgi:hypothetical protein